MGNGIRTIHFFFLLLKIFFKFYLNIFKDFLIKGCLSLAADRFTFPQDLPVTDSITVYNTSNHSFCTKMSEKYCCCRCLLACVQPPLPSRGGAAVHRLVVYWFKFYFPLFGVLVVSKPLNNS